MKRRSLNAGSSSDDSTSRAMLRQASASVTDWVPRLVESSRRRRIGCRFSSGVALRTVSRHGEGFVD